MKQRWKELAIVLGAAFFLTVILLLRTPLLTSGHPDFSQPWDHHKYIEMAIRDPLDFHIAPFCWRILVPLLAKTLPFSLQWNFLLISFTGIWLTGVTVYYIAKRFFSVTPCAAIGLITFFSLGWATRFPLSDFWLPDALSFLFVTLGIYGILAKREGLFLAVTVLGVCVKESVLFITPLYYTLNARQFIDWQALKRCMLMALPAFVALGVIRVIVPAMNENLEYIGSLPPSLALVQDGTSSYNYWQLLHSIGVERVRHLSLGDLVIYSFGTFGVLVMLLPFFSLKNNGVLLLKFIPFLLLGYAQLLFAVNNQRLIVLCFPAMILLALNGMASIAERLSLSVSLLFPLPLLFLLLTVLGVGNLEVQFLLFSLYLALAFQVRSHVV